VKIGDMVRRVPQGTDPQETSDYAELGVGVIVGTEDRISARLGTSTQWDMDYIVMWPEHGIGWEFPSRLEVINETR
jgi:hypothetical protein